MFGFACSETKALMPYPIQLAHRLLEYLRKSRRAGELEWARPDAKSQVTVQYEGYTPVAIDEILLSIHHAPDAEIRDMEADIRKKVISPVLEQCSPTLEWNDKLLLNPSGRFAIGGPHGDAGLTGRKIIVDTYGGTGRHGGGAFSGKDSTKVDRSAAYMARHIAKNIVKSGVAERCEIQLAYAIGKPDPVSIMFETFGTEKISDINALERVIRDIFPLSPYGIIEYLGLKKPVFSSTASFGHFGREPRPDGSFSWEKTDRADELASKLL
jgi:S-adenosylmethionine synthetase